MPIERGKETKVNPFFQAIQSTNLAYCAAHGLSAAEIYGTPPNADEIETHLLIAAGVPAEAAVPRVSVAMRMAICRLRIARDCRAIRMKYRNYYPDTPFERLARIERRLKGGAQ